jgi:hypothetical protein
MDSYRGIRRPPKFIVRLKKHSTASARWLRAPQVPVRRDPVGVIVLDESDLAVNEVPPPDMTVHLLLRHEFRRAHYLVNDVATGCDPGRREKCHVEGSVEHGPPARTFRPCHHHRHRVVRLPQLTELPVEGKVFVGDPD